MFPTAWNIFFYFRTSLSESISKKEIFTPVMYVYIQFSRKYLSFFILSSQIYVKIFSLYML